jgi:hypothetical protein
VRPNPETCVNLDHAQPSASYSEQHLGYGFGVSAASSTRRLLAPSPSSGGGRTPPAINYGRPRAALVAAAKVRRSSVQAGPEIMSVSIRFRPISRTKHNPRSASMLPSVVAAAAAIRRASSSLSNLAAERRPGSMSYLVHLLSSSESMDINSLASLDFGSTSSNPSINLKYSGPSLSISALACLVSVSTVSVSVC